MKVVFLFCFVFFNSNGLAGRNIMTIRMVDTTTLIHAKVSTVLPTTAFSH